MIVYVVKNLVDGKIYVGKTCLKLSTRWKNHVARAKHGSSTYLHRAIMKHGADSFSISELAIALTLGELAELEVRYIAELSSNTPEIGYNLTVGGEGSQGYRHTLEAKLRMSSAVRPLPSKEQREKIRAAGLGRKHTLQWDSRIAAANECRIAKICGHADYKMCCNCGQYDDPRDMKTTNRRSGSSRFFHTKSSKNWERCKELYRCRYLKRISGAKKPPSA